ncbi:hypothetical protein AMIS_58320 [Actinoplanes missouriensis 431]|uniref:Uncharacterized protein n=1 Tax=Actinoplanes missouriensis (strain ATCC 14538 / DSM 43046 / CBS 188.64 / JCM 3121 / NBRC 102363 / NCIMB 12654 / NRRL B-3342 / UNCC 431) TaxID=512565 RepID=I0HDG5_ACTM4|nr:hypothetical protein [Actinoplanes missouriensis]BAL91052.1 hypothetical protein AMIS_58320 [Actinoplanes missouriensis 431]
MRSANDTRLEIWRHVRSYAVPRSMIESATVRRLAGDWAGACAAARFDVDLDVRAVARAHGSPTAAALRADLRALAPDLLRWHLPRGGDGLLRPGLTVALARYGGLHLVARTPPAWADAGQRVSLALWERGEPRPRGHPHPRPDRRFRLDLHRCLWDAGRVPELYERADPAGWAGADGFAVHRWAAEAAILLTADGLPDGPVAVRRRPFTAVVAKGAHGAATTCPDRVGGRHAGVNLPVLPAVAVRVLPDVMLLRAGLVDAEQLHPLVAEALVPGASPPPARQQRDEVADLRIVECDEARHRIGPVDGVLAPLDHDPAELRREQLLVALGGTPLPCLRAVDAAIRHPEDLVDVRARLDHGDYAGALDTVESLLGTGGVLRDGALRDELRAAADQRVRYGLFRAGIAGHCPPRHPRQARERRAVRTHPRHAGGR